MSKQVVLSEYNPNWPKIFEKEAKSIQKILKGHGLEIHHIGSTSIKGMIAKPKIDILCIVDHLENSKPLIDLGYEFKGELNLPLHYYFRKKTDINKFNVHVVEPGDGFISMNLMFRDYLRNHPKDREEYINLKKKLVKDPRAHQKQASLFNGYNLGKNQFIKSILEKACFSDYSVSFCMHHKERQKYHDLMGASFENFSYSLDDPENFFFVLYKGPHILGACHLQINTAKPPNAVMNFFPDTEISNHQKYFTQFINKWLKNKNLPLLNY